MGLMKEFKAFAVKGNVMDMAIGIIIGAAFGKIVASLVADVIMPPLGLLIGGVNFTDIVIPLREAVKDPATGAVIKPEVILKLGSFIQTLFDFSIIAVIVFMLIKSMNRLKSKNEEPAPAPPAPPSPSKEEVLLTEIRDILKEKS